MRKGLSIILLFLVLSLLIFTPSMTVFAEGSATPCEIMQVSGGASGIISMTFDDGYYSTAVLLDELFDKYNLTGTIMMTVKSLGNSEGELVNYEKWKALLENSNIKIQNHTYNHLNLSNNGDPANQTEEVFYHEFIESREVLEELFPDNDIITLATPYGGISDAALDYIRDDYFAIRTTINGVQTLDPGFGDNNGDWTHIYSPVLKPYDDDLDQFTWIKSCIDRASEGWYAPIVHRVGDVDLTELPYDVADRVFAYIASLRDEGKVWVTDFANATKYIRERQNSTAELKMVGGVPYVSVKMSEYTADNLYLDPQIFDTPLTVRVPLPDGYDTVYYTVLGVEYKTDSFEVGGIKYAYLDILPNSEVSLRQSFSHTLGDYEKYDEEKHIRVCSDCGYIEYYKHELKEDSVILEPTHLLEGELLSVCLICDEDVVSPIERISEHTFDKEVKKGEYLKNYATCTTSREYYYSCECGLAGEKTFFSGNPLGHSFGEWVTELEPTDDTDGIRVRVCRCKVREEEVIPRLNQEPSDEDIEENENDGGDSPLPFIIVTSSAAIVVATAVLLFFIIRKKSKKE